MTTFSLQINNNSTLTSVPTQAEKDDSSGDFWPKPHPIQAIKQPLYLVLPMTPEMLPVPYRLWLTDIAERMQCPLDYVAIGAVVVTGSLIGSGCGICPKKKDSWVVIPNLWGGLIGPSVFRVPPSRK